MDDSRPVYKSRWETTVVSEVDRWEFAKKCDKLLNDESGSWNRIGTPMAVVEGKCGVRLIQVFERFKTEVVG